MSVIVATCQLPDIQGDIAAALEQIIAYGAQADRRSADILCLPECYLQGYTRNEATARERSLELTSQQCTDILNKLSVIKTTLVLGIIENHRGTLYNTAIVIRQGELLGSYRKAHPHEQIFEAGTQFPVFAVNNTLFGINICNDANYPEAAQAVADQGANLVFYPLNNRLNANTAEKWRRKHIQNLIERARQTGCWVISSDITHQDSNSIGYGCTAIVSPQGEVITKVGELKSGLIRASVL